VIVMYDILQVTQRILLQVLIVCYVAVCVAQIEPLRMNEYD